MRFQLSRKTAQSVGMHDRVALPPGFGADVLVYDLDELYFDMTRYEVVHDMPDRGTESMGTSRVSRQIVRTLVF